ncbi:MAG: hypothetical protein PUI99_08865 [Clostridiales bacterium]|nr:hypothetical protein [Clostridiales bacterium]
MKVLLKILPDLLAGAGAACIVVALWLISPTLGLTSAGVACLAAAVLLSLFSPREGRK